MTKSPPITEDGQHIIEVPEMKEYEELRWELAKILREYTIGEPLHFHLDFYYYPQRTSGNREPPKQHIIIQHSEVNSKMVAEDGFGPWVYEIADYGASLCGQRIGGLIISTFKDPEHAFEELEFLCTRCLRSLLKSRPELESVRDYLKLYQSPQREGQT